LFSQDHDDRINAMAFSSGGSILAIGCGQDPPRIGESEGQVHLWDVNARRKLGVVAGFRDLVITALAFSPDDRTLAVGDAAGGLALFDVETRRQRVATETWTAADKKKKIRYSFPAYWNLYRLVFSPDGRTLAALPSVDGRVRVWDAADLEERAPIPVGTNDIGALELVFEPSGNALALCCNHMRDPFATDPGTLTLWDLGAKRARWSFTSKFPIGEVAVSRDRRRVAFLNGMWGDQMPTDPKVVTVLDATTGRLMTTYRSRRELFGITVSPSGELLVCDGSPEGDVPEDFVGSFLVLADAATGRTRTELFTHYVGMFRFSKDGKRLAMVGGGFEIWDVDKLLAKPKAK